jgi:hypothetical protein
LFFPTLSLFQLHALSSPRLQRLELTDKHREGAEAAAAEVEDSQRLHLPELCREKK